TSKEPPASAPKPPPVGISQQAEKVVPFMLAAAVGTYTRPFEALKPPRKGLHPPFIGELWRPTHCGFPFGTKMKEVRLARSVSDGQRKLLTWLAAAEALIRPHESQSAVEPFMLPTMSPLPAPQRAPMLKLMAL